MSQEFSISKEIRGRVFKARFVVSEEDGTLYIKSPDCTYPVLLTIGVNDGRIFLAGLDEDTKPVFVPIGKSVLSLDEEEE